MKYYNEKFLIKLRKGIITIGLCTGIASNFSACNKVIDDVPGIEIEIEDEVEEVNEIVQITPTITPTVAPTVEPTVAPTIEPIVIPTVTPTPTVAPTEVVKPTDAPTPTVKPTEAPTPTVKPAEAAKPTVKPTEVAKPTVKPTEAPTPTAKPTDAPKPTAKPTVKPKPTEVEEPIEVAEGYLTKKQLTDKINSLIKKYPKVDKEDIKIRVIGANLDYIDDNVLFSILNIDEYSELKKYANDYYKAMDKSLETAFFTRAHNALGHPKPDYIFSEDVRMSDLFFDKALIKQAKYFDSLLKDMTDYKTRKISINAGVNLMGYFFDYYSEYFEYSRGEVYKFKDENVGEAASYSIDYYSIKVMLEVKLAEFYYYTPFMEAKEAEAKVKEYVDDQINPFTSRMNSIKKNVKR